MNCDLPGKASVPDKCQFPFTFPFFSAILFKGPIKWKCIHEQCILLQKIIQQQKDINGPWNPFI